MEGTFLYDLVAICLRKYRMQLEKDTKNVYNKWVVEWREKLENALNAEQLDIADGYAHSLRAWDEDIQLMYEIRVLNYGVKIGMELQKAFDDYEE